MAKRVGFLCSNPTCQKLTVGPNSNQVKHSNIGVAAHITAASEGGPRFNSELTVDQRKSINNGIWLCQTCSKLIDSDPQVYTIDILNAWKTQAEFYANTILKSRDNSANKINIGKLMNNMSDLLMEMSVDLTKNPNLREFILQIKGTIYNSNKLILVYYYEDHEHLEDKILQLENLGLVRNIQYNQVKRYILDEEFVEILKALNESSK